MSPLPPAPAGFRRPRLLPLVLGLVLASCGFSSRVEAARGRPYVNAAKTTLVGDNGQLLRGAIISTETGAYPSVSQLEGIKNVGLNAVHCYAERRDYGYSAGAKFFAVDMAVQRTRDAGLYLVITIGGGGFDDTFNEAFWNFYAPRYANETHVLYEIQNEPAAGSPPYNGNAALMRMQLNCYNIIRNHAPDTPVLLMSYSSFENGNGALQDIAALGSAIDWTKAVLSFHGYGEDGPAAIRAALITVLNAGYPCFQTEFYRWPWGTGNFALAAGPSLYQDVDETGDFERLGVSWLSFLTLSRVADAARFKNRLDNGGVTWAPDFGAWPVPGRAVYGNAGEPRTLLRTASSGLRVQAEDYDIGGENVAYHDATTTNSGGAYRTTEGVDVQTTTDTGGGHNVGWISNGEWLEYTVIVREAGLYSLNLRVASPAPTNALRVRLAGVDLTGAWSFEPTGANQTWTTISRTVSLVPGQQRLRVEALSSGFNFNWIEFVPVATGVLPNSTYRLLARSTGKAAGVVGAGGNGAKLEQRTYTAATNQRWVFTHRGANQYTLVQSGTTRGIDQAAGNSLSGDTLSTWGVSGSGSEGQRWIPAATDSGYYKLINARTGLAMEVGDASTAEAARIEIGEYAGGAHQQWGVTAPFVVTISATDADLGGIEGNGGQLIVSRDVAYSSLLTVNLSKGGTAAAGADYAALPASATIPANATSVTLNVSTISGQLPAQNKTLVVAIGGGSSYTIGAAGSSELAIRARDAFAQWAVDTFSAAEQADPLISGPGAAPFGDGVPNLLRAALDIGRESAAASLPVATVEDGHLVLRYRQLTGGQGTAGIDYTAGGLLYIVDATGDLAPGTWQNGPAVVEPAGAPQAIDPEAQLVAVRLKTPLAEQPRAFLRLRVVRAAP